MGLPAYLSPGMVSIYGAASTSSINGMTPDNIGYLFGMVDQVGDGNNVWARVGDSVMYNENNVVAQLRWNGNWYSLIEQEKIVLVETVLV
jgi:hypothetical protein